MRVVGLVVILLVLLSLDCASFVGSFLDSTLPVDEELASVYVELRLIAVARTLILGLAALLVWMEIRTLKASSRGA